MYCLKFEDVLFETIKILFVICFCHWFTQVILLRAVKVVSGKCRLTNYN